MHDLNRFKLAQDDPSDGYKTALAEMRAGRKQSHWIWYVFPQLAGLGLSDQAQFYGIDGVEEATEYLHDTVLRRRLVKISEVVATQLTGQHPVALTKLMGSGIDAQKLVSSMTLFEQLGKRMYEAEGISECAAISMAAHDILWAAAVHGYPACRFTLDRLKL